MRKSLPFILSLLLTVLYSTFSWSQCTPGDAVTCPDVLNNGEVCPDSLPGAIAGHLYSEAFTILAPPVYPVNETDTITLDHITLAGVTHLPEGFTWQSNTDSNEFMVGTYYCVLLEGTPATAGKYPLHITVDVYAKIFPLLPPILVATVTDSTSLFLEVKWDPNHTDDYPDKQAFILSTKPNPFFDRTRIEIRSREPGLIRLDVYDLVGQLRFTEYIQACLGTNYFDFNGHLLNQGVFILKVSSEAFSQTMRLIKTE